MRDTFLTLASISLGPLSFLVSKNLLSLSFNHSMSVVMATLIWMLVWWVLSKLPPAIPALIPFIIFSVYEILPTSELASSAGSPTILLFLGSFMISAAIEKWGLHNDFAFFFIKRCKHSISGLLGTFIFIAAFASMWISNTATVLILLPVIEALFPAHHHTKESRKLLGLFMLSVAYASSIGGLGTIIGSPPNAIAVDYLRQFNNTAPSFVQWMKMALPLCFTGCIILYLFFNQSIKKHLAKNNLTQLILNSIQETIRTHKIQWNFQKKSIAFILCLCVLSWFFASKISIVTGLKVNDSSIALAGGILLFLIPTKNKDSPFILNTTDLEKLPWSTLFLFAGGIALSKGLSTSGWIELSKSQLVSTQELSPFLLLFVIVSAGITLTEVMSNTALAALLVPWAMSLEGIVDIPILHIVFALCCASSLSFMMPVATPPNAIAFSKGHISLREMLKLGFILNLIFALLISAYVYWILPFIT